MDSTTELIRSLLAEICNVDATSIDDKARMVTYGLDSVRAIDLLIAIETALGVIIQQDDATNLHTIADVVAYVKRHQAVRD